MKHLRTLTRSFVALLAATTLVACGGEKEDTVVFTVTPQTVTIQDGSTPTVSIQAKSEWFVSMVTESWLTATPLSGSGNAMLTISANGENSTRQSRSAQIAITDRNSQQVCDVNVTQLPPTAVLTTDKQTLSFSQSSGSEYIAVKSNVGWSVTSTAAWCTVTPSRGNGDGSITVSVTRNEAFSPRNATITITLDDSEALPVSIAVTQAEYVEVRPGEDDNVTPAYNSTNN